MICQMKTSNFVNVKEAAEIIGCHESRVRQLLNDGTLEGVKFNARAWAVDRKSAEEMRDFHPSTGRPRGKSTK
jgi:hypothetical protein